MKRKDRGITLIALIVTIVILLILASITTYSGVNIIRQAKLNKFTTEMKVMQTEVNDLYDRYSSGEDVLNLGKDLDTQADNVFTSNASGITDKTGYRYYDQETIQSLEIDGVDGEFYINVEKRSVVSHDGLEYGGVTYYTLDQLPSGLYNVEYENRNTGEPTFDITVEQDGNNSWKVIVSNIQYDGYIDKWQIKYQKEGQDYWSTSEDLEFTLTVTGNYNIMIVNGDVTSDVQTFVVENTESMLANITGYETENTEVEDSLGNKVVIPAGFKVVNPEANVEDGIVIEDVSHEATAGSQFVWIPVGTIQTSSGEKTITLSRYTFDFDGTPTDQGTNIIESYYQELSTSTYGNTVAKDIEGFIESAEENGGYYLGRYEARTATSRTSSGDDLTQITEKPDEYVYNYVTQPQAASLSQGMYSDSNFESDLVNSYAWDTAIVFIQECSGDSDYSRQSSLNISRASKGTNNLDIQDVVCNIYDMASNCYEWTTETYSSSSSPCARRGGYYNYSSTYTASRNYSSTSTSDGSLTFRPLLYL